MSKKKKRVNNTSNNIEKNLTTSILLSPIFIIIIIFFLSYLIFNIYFKRFPFIIEDFLYNINPFLYISTSILNVLPSHLYELLKLVSLLISILGYGSFAIKKLDIKTKDIEKIILSYLIGVSIVVIFTLITGFLGLINKTIYLIFLLLGIGVFLINVKEFSINELITDIKNNKLIFFFFFVITSINIVQALSCEIFYDTLVYHLAVPNYWQIMGKIVDMPYNIYSKLALNHSILYLFCLKTFGQQTPLLINFLTSIFFYLSISYLFKNQISKKTSLYAGLLFYSIFHVIQSSQSATSDIIAGIYIVVLLFSILQFIETKKRQWIFLSGLFAGLGFGTKYNTGYIITAIFLLNLYIQIKNKQQIKEIFIQTIIFSLSSCVFTLPWFIKNIINYSNPLYPFAYSIFNKNLSVIDIEKINGFLNEVSQKNNFNFINWLKLPFLISTGQVPNSEFFTPIFLITLPLAIFNRRKNHFINYLWFLFWFSYVMWSISTTTIRHFFASYFILAILTAYYINDAFNNTISYILKTILYFTIILSIHYSLLMMHSESRYKVFNGEISRDEYLSISHTRYPMPSYSMYKYINENFNNNEKVLIVGDAKTFYLNKKFISSSVFDRNLFVDAVIKSKNEKEIYNILKENEITHILLNVIEAYRTQGGYKIFYWNEKDLEKVDNFLKNHMIEEKNFEKVSNNIYSEKLVLYRIVEKTNSNLPNYFKQITKNRFSY